MNRLYPFFLILIFITSCDTGSAPSESNGFDTACTIFSEASKQDMSPEELGQFIADRLNNMPNQKAKIEVIEVYHALFNVDPAVRYQLFKESAEMTLGREWDCPAVKALYRSE